MTDLERARAVYDAAYDEYMRLCHDANALTAGLAPALFPALFRSIEDLHEATLDLRAEEDLEAEVTE